MSNFKMTMTHEQFVSHMAKVRGSIKEVQSDVQLAIRAAMDFCIVEVNAAPLNELHDALPEKWQSGFRVYVTQAAFPVIWKNKDGESKLAFSLKKAKELAARNDVAVDFSEKFDSNKLSETDTSSLIEVAKLARAYVNMSDWTKKIEKPVKADPTEGMTAEEKAAYEAEQREKAMNAAVKAVKKAAEKLDEAGADKSALLETVKSLIPADVWPLVRDIIGMSGNGAAIAAVAGAINAMMQAQNTAKAA